MSRQTGAYRPSRSSPVLASPLVVAGLVVACAVAATTGALANQDYVPVAWFAFALSCGFAVSGSV